MDWRVLLFLLGILTGMAAVITYALLRREVREGFQDATTAAVTKSAAQLAIDAAVAINKKVLKIIDLDTGALSTDPNRLDISKRGFIKWAVERDPTQSAENIRADLRANYDARFQEYMQTAEDISAKEEAAAIEAANAREAKIQAIIQPRRTDVFKIEFPRSFVEWAVQRSPNASAEELRTDLIEKYNLRLAEFRSVSTESSARDAAWTADPKARTCAEASAAKQRFLAMLTSLRPKVQDLSGNLYSAVDMKEQNRTFQQEPNVKAKCMRSESENCIALARLDEELITTVPWYEGVNTEIFNRQIDLAENIFVLNQVLLFLGCDKLDLEILRVDPDTGKVIINTSPNSQELGLMVQRLGYMDTPLLRMKLSELSPYYLSPDVLQYITQYLINKEEVDAKINTYGTIRDDITKSSARINEYAKD